MAAEGTRRLSPESEAYQDTYLPQCTFVQMLVIHDLKQKTLSE